ncbi:MAG: hypothetical protein QM658_08295 [Gordonia sp. (in: high G+C Gram-positive bacteria)]
MTELYEHIEDRGVATPWMTAVRLGGSVVTYGELYERVCEYDDLMDRHALSENATVATALMTFFPEPLRKLPPAEQARWVSDALVWLSRDFGSSRHALGAVV